MNPGRASAAGGLTVFVYFRSPPAAREAVVDALQRHFGAVAKRCGVRGRGSLRDERGRPYLTFLETWDGITPQALDAVLAAIEQSAIESGLSAHAPEGRHREIFEAIAIP